MSANTSKFPEKEQLYPPTADTSRLLASCRRNDYSASRIAHAVEDCDAHLLNLNVISWESAFACTSLENYEDAKFQVFFDLRVSHRNAEKISQSLERYGFNVLSVQSDSDSDYSSSDKALLHLKKYLEI